MARPFDSPNPASNPLRPTVPQRPTVKTETPNRFSALTEVQFPKLSPPMPTKLVDLKTNLPLDKGSSAASSSSIQTKQSYAMKAPETFAQAVNPTAAKVIPSSPVKEEFKFVISTVMPIIALDKAYEGYPVSQLIKPVYTNNNFVDTEDPLKTRRFYEAILVDTDSIEVEHSLDTNNPDYISYSKFTIKRILTPFNWFVDHLHTPIALSMPHRPQTYNWHDYRAAWFNFMYVRPGHTWFVKYCPAMVEATIPRWFYEWWSCFGGTKDVLPQQFLNRFPDFLIKEGCSTLPEHIQMCKYFIKKRISYIISWTFSKEEQHRIKYLSKEIKIKGWTPKPTAPKTPDQGKAATTASPLSSASKKALKEKLKQALAKLDGPDNTDNTNTEELLQLIAEASSTGSSSDNGDMLDPKGIAMAYLDPY